MEWVINHIEALGLHPENNRDHSLDDLEDGLRRLDLHAKCSLFGGVEDKFEEDKTKDDRLAWGQLQYSRSGRPGLRDREKEVLREVLEVDSPDLCNSLDAGIVLERWNQDNSTPPSVRRT